MNNYDNMPKAEVEKDIASRESLIHAMDLSGQHIVGGYQAAIFQLQQDYMKYIAYS